MAPVEFKLSVRVAWWLPFFIRAARGCARIVYACGGRIDEGSLFFRFLTFVVGRAVVMPQKHG
jgi:hypothetical protein